MATTRLASLRLAILRHPPWQEVRRGAGEWLKAALFHLVGGTVLLALLACLYAMKRALGLDLVPGIDMLPDAEIEDALSAMADLLGG